MREAVNVATCAMTASAVRDFTPEIVCNQTPACAAERSSSARASIVAHAIAMPQLVDQRIGAQSGARIRFRDHVTNAQ